MSVSERNTQRRRDKYDLRGTSARLRQCRVRKAQVISLADQRVEIRIAGLYPEMWVGFDTGVVSATLVVHAQDALLRTRAQAPRRKQPSA